MPWSMFFTVVLQVLIVGVILFVGSAALVAVINGIRKEKQQ